MYNKVQIMNLKSERSRNCVWSILGTFSKGYRSTCTAIIFIQNKRVCISQLIRYSKVVGSYNDIIDRGSLPTKGLLYQGFLVVQLKSSLRTINDCHHGLANIYGICMLSIADHCNGELDKDD